MEMQIIIRKHREREILHKIGPLNKVETEEENTTATIQHNATTFLRYERQIFT